MDRGLLPSKRLRLHLPWPLPDYPSSSSFSSWKIAVCSLGKMAVCSLGKMALVTAQEVQMAAVYFPKEEEDLLDEEEGRLNQCEGLIELADRLTT